MTCAPAPLQFSNCTLAVLRGLLLPPRRGGAASVKEQMHLATFPRTFSFSIAEIDEHVGHNEHMRGHRGIRTLITTRRKQQATETATLHREWLGGGRGGSSERNHVSGAGCQRG